MLQASREGQLASVCLLESCQKLFGQTRCDALHFALAATAEQHRDRGLTGTLLDAVRRFFERPLRKPGLGFAYIEACTEFSLRLSERIGHELEADLDLVLSSRLNARPDARMRCGLAADRVELVRGLDRLHRDHVLTDFATSVWPERMLLLVEEGQMRAAVQVEPLRWSDVSLPGATGGFLLRLLPRIPWLKRVVDPPDVRSARIGNILVEPGREDQRTAVLETALSRLGCAFGLTVIDRRSPHC